MINAFINDTKCNNYRKILNSRNALLKRLNFEKKESNTKLLEVMNSQLVKSGNKIINVRQKIVRKLNDEINEIYNEISGCNEKIELEYCSNTTEEKFLNQLRLNYEEELKSDKDTYEDRSQNIKELKSVLREAEEIELVSEEEMFRPELDEVQDEGLQIDIEDGVYVVTGKSLRRIMYSVNFDDMESLQYFQKAMESQGVFDRLREMGIEDGDTVRIYEIEFEFYN